MGVGRRGRLGGGEVRVVNCLIGCICQGGSSNYILTSCPPPGSPRDDTKEAASRQARCCKRSESYWLLSSLVTVDQRQSNPDKLRKCPSFCWLFCKTHIKTGPPLCFLGCLAGFLAVSLETLFRPPSLHCGGSSSGMHGPLNTFALFLALNASELNISFGSGRIGTRNSRICRKGYKMQLGKHPSSSRFWRRSPWLGATGTLISSPFVLFACGLPSARMLRRWFSVLWSLRFQ